MKLLAQPWDEWTKGESSGSRGRQEEAQLSLAWDWCRPLRAATGPAGQPWHYSAPPPHAFPPIKTCMSTAAQVQPGRGSRRRSSPSAYTSASPSAAALSASGHARSAPPSSSAPSQRAAYAKWGTKTQLRSPEGPCLEEEWERKARGPFLGAALPGCSGPRSPWGAAGAFANRQLGGPDQASVCLCVPLLYLQHAVSSLPGCCGLP